MPKLRPHERAFNGLGQPSSRLLVKCVISFVHVL